MATPATENTKILVAVATATAQTLVRRRAREAERGREWGQRLPKGNQISKTQANWMAGSSHVCRLGSEDKYKCEWSSERSWFGRCWVGAGASPYCQRPPAGHKAPPQAANNHTRPSHRCRTGGRLPCDTSWLMRFQPLEASRDAGFGRHRPHLVAVHRLSLGLAERLAEEDKHEGKGVVRTTRQSM